MFSNRNTALSLAAIAALVLVAAPPVDAQGRGGGGGGGGGGNAASGTIYFIGPFEGATGFGTAQMTAMKADGSDKTRLSRAILGHPSTERHNGHTWFITTKNRSGYYPDGVRRREVIVFRDDYDAVTNNNATTKAQLTDDITLEPEPGMTDWVPGGQQISFSARRWSALGLPDHGGLYTASLSFDLDGNINGLVAQPAAPAIPFPLNGGWPAFGPYSWAPDGDWIAYEWNGLWLADRFTAPTLIATGGTHAPKWSPDGSKIAFSNGWGISTIKPDGRGRRIVVPDTSALHFHHPYWSPTGKHLVFTGQDELGGFPPNQDVYTATSKGGDLTNLTTNTLSTGEFLIHDYGGGWQ